jgi:RNA polymerase sigma-70 factor (ECF subfamily)
MATLKNTEEIINELQQGRNHEENFQLLWERYYGQIYRFFQRKGFLPEDCKDLAQDVFTSVYKGVKNFRQESRFETWLFKIAMNAYKTEIERRRAKKRDAIEVMLEDEHDVDSDDQRLVTTQLVDSQATPVEVLLDKEKLEKFRVALQELPDQMRFCVQLRTARDLSYQEIASIMGISINTVKAHLHQAQKVLKEKLNPYFNEVEI